MQQGELELAPRFQLPLDKSGESCGDGGTVLLVWLVLLGGLLPGTSIVEIILGVLTA